MRAGFKAIQTTEALPGQPVRVRMEAGILSMGAVVRLLASIGRAISQGLSGAPGMGCLLSGGIGPLGRRFGLGLAALRGMKWFVLTDGSCICRPAPRPGPPRAMASNGPCAGWF